MFILGLTGSLGMGKSTTARFFAEEGVPVHDADGVVHRLYDGEAAAAIEAAFPDTTAGGKVDRDKLAARVLGDSAALKRLEAIVHPLVQDAERRLLAEAEARGEKVAVLDIPLLFETGGGRRGGGGGGGLPPPPGGGGGAPEGAPGGEGKKRILLCQTKPPPGTS